MVVAGLAAFYLLHQQESTAADACEQYKPASLTEMWGSIGEDTPYWRCVNESRYEQGHE